MKLSQGIAEATGRRSERDREAKDETVSTLLSEKSDEIGGGSMADLRQDGME